MRSVELNCKPQSCLSITLLSEATDSAGLDSFLAVSQLKLGADGTGLRSLKGMMEGRKGKKEGRKVGS